MESYSEVSLPLMVAADSESWTAQDDIVRLEKLRHKFHSTHKALYTAIISKEIRVQVKMVESITSSK